VCYNIEVDLEDSEMVTMPHAEYETSFGTWENMEVDDAIVVHKYKLTRFRCPKCHKPVTPHRGATHTKRGAHFEHGYGKIACENSRRRNPVKVTERVGRYWGEGI
jgi:hypothetical protein